VFLSAFPDYHYGECNYLMWKKEIVVFNSSLFSFNLIFFFFLPERFEYSSLVYLPLL